MDRAMTETIADMGRCIWVEHRGLLTGKTFSSSNSKKPSFRIAHIANYSAEKVSPIYGRWRDNTSGQRDEQYGAASGAPLAKGGTLFKGRTARGCDDMDA